MIHTVIVTEDIKIKNFKRKKHDFSLMSADKNCLLTHLNLTCEIITFSLI